MVGYFVNLLYTVYFILFVLNFKLLPLDSVDGVGLLWVECGFFLLLVGRVG